MKVCIVSVPLTTRSGVYRSTYDLVTAAREAGLDWSGIIAMRPSALGSPPQGDLGVHETTIDVHGMKLIPAIRRLLLSRAEFREADVVITMIGQSDIAVSGLGSNRPSTWVSFVRGLPWPAHGEAKALRRVLQRVLVTRAMRKADEVWATTTVLADGVRSAVDPVIVPAGVPSVERIADGSLGRDGHLVFAGRLDRDKRPLFFAEIVRRTGALAKAFGAGPLQGELEQSRPETLDISGWVDPAALWQGATAFLGTSSREAFGRSAVEAAQHGVPVILSRDYGAAPFLITDPELVDAFVLPSEPVELWVDAVQRLLDDEALRRRLSDHLVENAREITIERSVARVDARLRELAAG
ncbi:glycosyl transferase [Pseudoclavibacter sp. RFBJ3]|uniref:glycosyltransferase family 4 protein n=1 Tax=unclassified Pseudoclavibacter TaxID=2615177 RepID=UPI000CE78A31|nr:MULTISPECIES: glycosyltransferase family 4 protein [unclassified Pseudoclavibacter]PPF81944.1 glycosyl transferase [Pseudoclavibacter sp. RFBJ5]PPF95442.1 glycosyl transferase [Pseudoclavibacter sp. RFBJ3]PPF95918.1 glycosyl transferase [Pseudoclavibacter sp. RFBH5]PPG21210.1 glycosyl transferase [Pseudoclavibacter sp. RFBI4]